MWDLWEVACGPTAVVGVIAEYSMLTLKHCLGKQAELRIGGLSTELKRENPRR